MKQPYFVKTEHTSQGQSHDGSYQTPKATYGRAHKAKVKGQGGWGDDDDSTSNNVSTIKSPWSRAPKTPQYTSQSSQGQYENHKQNEESEKKHYPSIDLEKQLVDNILAPTGITAKPSDYQFKDFMTRVKNLNKTLINALLRERILQFEEHHDIKPLQKCLHVIEYSLINKIPGISEYFIENSHLLTDLQNNFPGIKKICELAQKIIVLMGKDSREKERDNEDEVNESTNNDKPQKYNFIKKKDANKELDDNSNLNVGTVDDIFDLQKNNSNNLLDLGGVTEQVDLLGINSETSNNINSNDNTSSNTAKKGFAFLNKNTTKSNNTTNNNSNSNIFKDIIEIPNSSNSNSNNSNSNDNTPQPIDIFEISSQENKINPSELIDSITGVFNQSSAYSFINSKDTVTNTNYPTHEVKKKMDISELLNKMTEEPKTQSKNNNLGNLGNVNMSNNYNYGNYQGGYMMTPFYAMSQIAQPVDSSSNVKLCTKADDKLSKKIAEEIFPEPKKDAFSFVEDLMKKPKK